MIDNSAIAILGCGGHARSVADILLANEPKVRIVFIDEAALPDERIYGFEVVREIETLHDRKYFPAIGDSTKREGLLKKYGFSRLINIVSRRAYFSQYANLCQGVFVGAGAHVGPFAEIGVGAIINSCAILEHEVKVGAFSHVAPNATVSGRCTLGEHVFIGAGSVVRDGISISSNIVVGAGSVVVKNLVEPGVYVGSPVRKIR